MSDVTYYIKAIDPETDEMKWTNLGNEEDDDFDKDDILDATHVEIPINEYNGLLNALRIVKDRVLQDSEKSRNDEHGYQLISAKKTLYRYKRRYENESDKEHSLKAFLITKKTPYPLSLDPKSVMSFIINDLRNYFSYATEGETVQWNDSEEYNNNKSKIPGEWHSFDDDLISLIELFVNFREKKGNLKEEYLSKQRLVIEKYMDEKDRRYYRDEKQRENYYASVMSDYYQYEPVLQFIRKYGTVFIFDVDGIGSLEKENRYTISYWATDII